MAYIYPAPGVVTKQATLVIKDKNNEGGYTANESMTIPAMQDITVANSKDVSTWTQLDNTGKFNLPTTSANDISGNLVLEKDTFFGDGITDGIQDIGIQGAQTASTLVEFELYTGTTSDGQTGKYISGEGYITGLTYTVSSDEPVWKSPYTISVNGEYVVSDTAQIT